MKLDYGWTNAEDFRKWGPYLSYGNDASSEMRISWQSKFFSMSRWIEYGETKELGQKIEEDIEPKSMHLIILKDLKPNTEYFFKISRPEDLKMDPQPIYKFTTGPEEGSQTDFEFCIASDMHAENGSAIRTFESMKNNAPDAEFLVTCGDCVTHGGKEEKWNDFFCQFAPYADNFPLMNATGNHDTDHPESYAHFVQTFHHPYCNTKDGAYYYFIYGNAVFIMLDSDNAGQTTARQGVISDDQMDWLEETLEKFALKNYWIFVCMHHEMYSTGDFGMVGMYELAYRDLFDEYHVDGVFFGHDHHFEVFWALKDSEWGGTHYCLVGNGGDAIDMKLRNAYLKPRPPNYIWKGRTYVFERDGILDGDLEGPRNDEFIKKAHQYGVMETGFTRMHIKGDTCEMIMFGLENQIYFKSTFKRTDAGKKYIPPEIIREF